jgi:carbonic anhydrase
MICFRAGPTVKLSHVFVPPLRDARATLGSQTMNSSSANGTLLLAGILILTSPIISVADTPNTAHWAYTGPEDPAHWASLDPAYSACSQGHAQSPIDITNAQIADLPVLKPDYQPNSLDIIDNGHTIQVNVAPGSVLTVGDKTYALKQFHFHHPSEEHFAGKTFPLEAHLVHQDGEGHLAVIAVVFEQGKANPLIESLWQNIPTEKGGAVALPSVSIRLQDLLPTQLGYFTYTGSLTTPPCTEGVTWYVLMSHATVSAKQIATFAKLYPSDARPVQASNGRIVLRSK